MKERERDNIWSWNCIIKIWIR